MPTTPTLHHSHTPPPAWLRHPGSDQDVVISSRCRIARNLSGIPFPWRASELERKVAAERIIEAIHRGSGPLSRSEPVNADNLTGEQIEQLEAWRYTSRAWSETSPYRFVLISHSGDLSLLVNEEDHVRMQSILPGSQIDCVMELASDSCCRMEAGVEFAKDAEIGYLTASLTNAGQGIRLSVLMHLIGLALSRRLESAVEASVRTGCAVRGLYGEGTSATGAFFQVSNSHSFGLRPEQLVARVRASAGYLIEAERSARRELFGGVGGRNALQAQVEGAAQELLVSDLAPERLLNLASILRVAISEDVIEGELTDTSEWVYLAGSCADLKSGSAAERFQAIRRSAALRQRLRTLFAPSGTL